MGGDKIVLLDGAGANGGGGAATNGLLSMIPGMFANLIGGNKMDPNLVAALMNGNQLEYVFDNINLDHITFKGNGKESFSFNRALVENLIETFDTMQDIYSDNYGIKVYTGNCIIQLNVNPKNLSESFFDVYDRDEMKLIYSIKNSILKEMFII